MERGALYTPALIGVRLIFKNGVIRAGVKGSALKRAGGKRADKVCGHTGHTRAHDLAYSVHRYPIQIKPMASHGMAISSRI